MSASGERVNGRVVSACGMGGSWVHLVSVSGVTYICVT